MVSSMKKYFIAIILFSTLTVAVWSQPIVLKTNTGKGIQLYKNSYALIIGASNYNNGWPKLEGVMQDVAQIKDILEEQEFNIVTVIDPTLDEIRTAYSDFINKYGLDPDNRLLFYFAGHGHTIHTSYGEEMGYIVPVDAPNPNNDKNGFLSKALAMQQIEVYAKQIQSKHAIFLFDACFSGSIFAISRAIPENISYKTTKPVRQFITSGSADETVPDESVFRTQFISALEGEADFNKDGFITGTELGEFLQEKVVNYSRGSQHPQYGKIRNPHLDKGDFVFLSSAETDSELTAASTVETAKTTTRAEKETETADRIEKVTVYNPITNEPLMKSIKEMPTLFNKFAIMTDNGHFLSAEKGGGGNLVANREGVATWETFRIVPVDDNKIAFKTYNDYYLAIGENTKALDARYKKIDSLSTFQLFELEGNNFALKASNGLFVAAEFGGEHQIRARSEFVNPYEVFKFFHVNTFGIISDNGHYATCSENGKITFIKNKLEENEVFEFVKIDSNRVSIKAPNGKYIKIDDDGSYAALDMPNAESVFEVEEIDKEHIKLKTMQGKYVTAIGGGGYMMRARENNAGAWETFKIYPTTPKKINN